MSRTVVVTGASGFVGRHLVRHLSEQGSHVVALSRQAGPQGSHVERVSRYADYNPPAGAVLVHLAEPPHIATVDAQGESHIAQMLEQADALLTKQYARKIYVSSATVYGDSNEEPWRPDETVPPSPKIYAQSKWAVERKFLAADGAIARLTNLYGPGMAQTTIFADLILQLGKPGPVTIREATPERDYLWIGDAASALGRMARGSQLGVFNVASGSSITCRDLAALILKHAGERDRPVVAMLPDRRSVLRLDISKTTSDFGWAPETDLDTGIRKLLELQ